MRAKRSNVWRAGVTGLALLGLLLQAGGPQAQSSTAHRGIDPLEVLKLQVKNNVLFVFDTSGSMKWPLDIDSYSVGSDDPMSRMFQAKQAVEAVVNANRDRLNMGMATYEVLANDKILNGDTAQENFDGDGRFDGPLVYVTNEPNAALFYQVYPCPQGGNVDGFFCDANDTFNNYNGTNSEDVFRSFMNENVWDDPYPPGCTVGVDCRFYIQSRLLRNGERISVDLRNSADTYAEKIMGVPAAITCPAPPPGLLADDDPTRPCFQIQVGASNNAAEVGRVATFWYTSAIYTNNSGISCGGAGVITNVAPCDDFTAQQAAIQLILDTTRLELPVNTLLTELTASGPELESDQTTIAGIRAGQSTPIGGSLNEIRGQGPFFPVRPAAVQGFQRNFVILLTDGDDTCGGTTQAAQAAQDLYYQGCAGTGVDCSIVTTDPRHQAETLVIAFTTAVDIAGANRIAQAGSGGVVQGNGSVNCPPDVPCRDAFFAQNIDDLIKALLSAIELAAAGGEFSAAPSTLASVFELGPLVNAVDCHDPPTQNFPGNPECADPLDPDTRFNNRVNVLYQTTFEMPNWQGHLFGFLNDGSFQPIGQNNFTGRWDAGETLFEQISQVLEVTDVGRGVNRFTFAELHGGSATTAGATARNIRTSTAPIKRRIFTSSPVAGSGSSAVNRSYPRNVNNIDEWDGTQPEAANVVALWPPNQTDLDNGLIEPAPPNTAIDPAVGTVGPFDDLMGIGPGSNPVMSFTDLRSRFKACDGATPPAACNVTASPVLALDTARKEARQIILAFTAGAELIVDANSRPVRVAGGPDNGQLLYKDRGWLMIDTTFAQPAVVTPPLRATPNKHITEFLLFRDGRRDTDRQGLDEIDQGFGLRNPDFDDLNPETKLDLKPVMTVVYLATNHMLHSFRAGPNCDNVSSAQSPPAQCPENGSQELWAFVPIDQLAKLGELILGQVQNPHVYMVASSPRIADIFVPGILDSLPVAGGQPPITYHGRWRTVLYFGRGAGGKFYTALDITSPGPFTRLALETNPPYVMWNAGNEENVVDAFDGMGESWSVPSVGNVQFVDADLDSLPDVPEWRVWVGSGYSTNPTEGTTFYMLDAVTGDILDAANVGDGTPTFVPDNALVAAPALYNEFQLRAPGETVGRSLDFVSRIYIPDVHGRLWKFNTSSGGAVANLGPAQPFANAVALLRINSGSGPLPHVYAESGNDSRVPDPGTPLFKAYGWQDTAAETDLSTPLTPLFTPLDFPGQAGLSGAFRGTLQPAAAFNAAGNGRIFYVGTRFNSSGVNCLSSFDTILFGIGAITGGAAYDFSGGGGPDLSTILIGKRATGVQAIGGQLLIGESGTLTNPPSTPPPPMGTIPPPAEITPASVYASRVSPGSSVCRP